MFNGRKVRYLVVGGHAVMKYTEPRYTKDLDVWIDASPANASAVYEALIEFGAPLSGITPRDFATPGLIYQMGRPPARVDVLTSIEGVRFAEAWPNRVAADFDGTAAHPLSRADLITNKRAVGRPQDLIDVDNMLESERLTPNARDSDAPKKKRGPKRRSK